MIKTKNFFALVLVFILLFALSSCNSDSDKNNEHTPPPDNREELYNQAVSDIEEKNYEKAYSTLLQLWDYKDTQALLDRFTWKATAEKTIEGDKSTLHEFAYDERGNVIRSAYVHSVSTTEYVYDENDNLLSQRTDSTFDGGTSFTAYEYTYGENGLLIKKRYYDSSKNDIIYQYTYDENNMLIKEVRSGQSADSETEYSYNENGLLEKKEHYFYGRSEITEYTYDENGNLLEEKMTASNGQNSLYKYTYDENGNCLKKDMLKTNGLHEITECTYNEYNIMVQKKRYPHDIPENVTVWSYYYDENLCETKRHCTTSRGYTSDIEYSGYVLFYSEK